MVQICVKTTLLNEVRIIIIFFMKHQRNVFFCRACLRHGAIWDPIFHLFVHPSTFCDRPSVDTNVQIRNSETL